MKKSLLSKFLKGAALAGITLFSFNSATAQVNVTVENLGTTPWTGYVNFFENNGNFENNVELTYVTGQAWGVADMKTTLNATDNTIKLQPNYNGYNATDPVWSDGNGNGNRIFEGNSYVERTDLAGQQLVFSGMTVSTTLLPAFRDVAFIKVINPANNYATEFTVNEALVEGENFTLSTGSFTIEPGRIVQYGFSVIGKNANPTQEEANGFTLVTADEPEEPQEPADVVVTLDTTNPGQLLGYANWFELDGTTYINGGVYGVSDLKTVVNTTDNTFVLYPNFFAYGDGTNPEWASGGLGTRIFEGNTYIEDNTLINQNVTFQGHCVSNTLADGYTAIAFVKLMSATYGLLGYITQPLVDGEDFAVSVDTALPIYAGTAHVQYGYSVTGRNANPTQEAALGNAVITGTTAGVADFSKKAVIIYPNPASNVLNFASENAIEGIQVYNVMGQKVIDAKPAQNNATVDVSGLTNGVYIVNTTINGKQDSARFIKQ